MATAQRIGAEQRLGAAPHRHVVGAGYDRVDADHAVRKRQRRVDAGCAGVVRAPRAHPGDADLACDLDRGLGRARHHQVAHAVVAVDQRGRRCGLGDLDIWPRVHSARLQPPHILRQPEHAVGVGAGEVGLGHQLRHLGGVGRRQTNRRERVGDQPGNRCRGYPCSFFVHCKPSTARRFIGYNRAPAKTPSPQVPFPTGHRHG